MVWSSAPHVAEALHLLEQAIVRDPGYGLALAWAATCCFRLLVDGQSPDREADRLKGVDYASRALEVAGNDPSILVNAAHALAFFGEDIGAMMAMIDRALVLNPSFAQGWHNSGALRIWAGQPAVAIEHIETALRLSPREPVRPVLTTMGAAHFFARRFDEAVPKLLQAIHETPSWTPAYQVLAACYAHMGRIEEARDIVAQLRAFTSAVIPDDVSFMRRPQDRELWLSGLRLAMGAEK
jgi:tetratricopeptide (TPR) repeat protein